MSRPTCGDCRLLFVLQAGHGCRPGIRPSLRPLLSRATNFSVETRARGAARTKGHVVMSDERICALYRRQRVVWTPTPALRADPPRRGEGEVRRPTLHAVVTSH